MVTEAKALHLYSRLGYNSWHIATWGFACDCWALRKWRLQGNIKVHEVKR